MLFQNDSIYLLRFSAKTYSIGGPLDDKMDMNVFIECGDTTYRVRFVVRHGSYLYHLPFKTHSKNVNVRFTFPVVGTYYVDAVELISENNDVNIDVRKTYIWSNNRKQSDWQWVEDTILVGGKVNNLYWVGDALFDPKESKVKVYLVDLNLVKGELQETGNTYMGEFSYLSLEYLGAKLQKPCMHRWETFFVDNDTVYLFWGENDAWTQWTHLARTPISNILGDKEPLQYWGETGWTTYSTKSVRINHMRLESIAKFAEGELRANFNFYDYGRSRNFICSKPPRYLDGSTGFV